MANYAVTVTTYGPDTLANVSAAIETYLETVDSLKVIRYLGVYPTGGGLYEGVVVVDT